MPLLEALVGDSQVEAHFADEADLAALLTFESALARSQAAVGMISQEAAARIAEVCAEFSPDWQALARGVAKDGVVVPEFVVQVRAAVGEPHAAAVHKGVTSQDAVDTSLMLRLAAVIDILEGRLDRLVGRLADIIDRNGAGRLMAHTRMQAALPFTVGDKVETWRAPLGRCRARMAGVRSGLLCLQLGGPVGTRAELGPEVDAIAAGMAQRLGLADARPWHSQRDGLAEFAAWLSLASGLIGKMGQDVSLMAQSEVGALTLASAGGSSAMAHKRNPVQAEILVAFARFNAGLLGTMHQALVHENERSGAAWALEWLVLPRMAVTTGAALRTAIELTSGLDFCNTEDQPA